MREQHLDLDALADLLAGEGTADDVEHVAQCADCSASLADLEDALGEVDPVLEALLTAPVPDLPEGFDERLSARLAGVVPDAAPAQDAPLVGLPRVDDDEEEEDVAPLAAAPEREPAPVVPLRRRPRGAGLLGVAAGGVGLVLAGVLGLSLASGGADRGEESATAGALPATGGEEQGAPESAQDSAAGAAAGAAPGPLVLASGTDYAADPAAVQALLPRLLQEEAGAAARSDAQQPAPAEAAPAPASSVASGLAAAGPLAALREPAALQACLEAVASTAAGSPPEVAPVALDYATSQGEPALVVVQRAGAGLVEVTAVGPGCSAEDPDRLWSLRLPG